MPVDLWGNIPDGLKNLKQWCISTLPDKAPKHYNATRKRLENSSPTTGPFHTFSDACSLAESVGGVIGCCVLNGNGLAFIDFDIKDTTHADETPTPWGDVEFFGSSVDMVGTYCELSQSGKGLHIIAGVQGDVESCRSPGKELYTTDRYFIFTGNAISKIQYTNVFGVVTPHVIDSKARPIQDETRFVNIIHADISANKTSAPGAKAILVEGAQEFADSELWERARGAGNDSKFLALCRGEWEGVYPSQSEADMALMSMFTFYSNNNEQCRRMFRQTKLGERSKATKNNAYLNRTLQLIRGRELHEQQMDVQIDVDSIRETSKIRALAEPTNEPKFDLNIPPEVHAHVAQMNAQYHVNTAQQHFQKEPPPLLPGMDWPPGLTGEIAHFIYQSSYRPVKEIAITSALAFMAGVCGKAFSTPTHTGLNLFLILIARSGVGKEALHSGLTEILKQCGHKTIALNNFIDFTNYVSAPALMKSISVRRSTVNVGGEWGRRLKRMSAEDSRGDSQAQQLRTLYTELYSKTNSAVSGMGYSDKDKSTETDLNGVAFSIVGESTPGTFMESLTETMMEDGFLSRFSIIEYAGERPAENKAINTIMPEYLINRISTLADQCSLQISQLDTTFVQYTEESQTLLNDFNLLCDVEIKKAGGDESLRQLWSRAHLKVLRIACLLAVGDNHIQPTIQPVHFQWAYNLVSKNIELLKRAINDGDVGMGSDTRKRKLLRVIREYIQYEVSGSYRINPQMIKDGIIPRRYIQGRIARSSAFSNHRLDAATALTHSLRDLVADGHIVECSKAEILKNYRAYGECFKVVMMPD